MSDERPQSGEVPSRPMANTHDATCSPNLGVALAENSVFAGPYTHERSTARAGDASTAEPSSHHGGGEFVTRPTRVESSTHTSGSQLARGPLPAAPSIRRTSSQVLEVFRVTEQVWIDQQISKPSTPWAFPWVDCAHCAHARPARNAVLLPQQRRPTLRLASPLRQLKPGGLMSPAMIESADGWPLITPGTLRSTGRAALVITVVCRRDAGTSLPIRGPYGAESPTIVKTGPDGPCARTGVWES